jgi:hypothetical protein
MRITFDGKMWADYLRPRGYELSEGPDAAGFALAIDGNGVARHFWVVEHEREIYGADGRTLPHLPPRPDSGAWLMGWHLPSEHRDKDWLCVRFDDRDDE